jgi:hypothetical protein
MQRVEEDGMADCALQCWKTYLCSNVLSALKPMPEGAGLIQPQGLPDLSQGFSPLRRTTMERSSNPGTGQRI